MFIFENRYTKYEKIWHNNEILAHKALIIRHIKNKALAFILAVETSTISNLTGVSSQCSRRLPAWAYLFVRSGSRRPQQ
jgi:hypothetical protein